MATADKKIGKYDVIDVIGRGGMGVVYQAKDPYLDRLVAIKMMNVDLHENPDFLQRFYAEAKSLASLQHPNIVTVYDLGEYQNRPFLVMQYLEGQSLASLLHAHRPMTVLEKLNIIIQVCQGLGYAHQHGVIHRDIKPGNIMVLNDESVKIVDFGIARLGDNSITRTGQVVGSLHYVPPEQLQDERIDTRADIYSTGAVLYQLLTSSLPFEGESVQSTLLKILRDDPPPFSRFGLSCPPELEAITLKALAKNRDQRFPTAEAFAAALTEVLDGFRQASIKEYLAKVELLQQSNELQQAQEYLLKVLKFDRQNTVASKQLSAIRSKLQAQLSAERVRHLKQQAEEAYARDEFDVALGFLNQAIELDNNPDLQTLRGNTEKAKADAEVVREAISRAEAAQRSGDLDSAKSAIDSALSRRPNDSKIMVLRRAIERDLVERERQRQVEGLLDGARTEMAGRKFTGALDLLREAQKLDPSAPQLRILLERLASEHQQEKQRRQLEHVNREVQEAIDRDDYKAASARAAEALAEFPNEAGLARLKELVETQIEIAAQEEFVRNQAAAAQQLLDNGQAQHALDLVEKALEKVSGNSRLESLRTMIQDRLARDQQAKARRQASIEEAMRGAQRLLADQDFEGAVGLLEKAVIDTPSEDLDLLLSQARDQQDARQRHSSAPPHTDQIQDFAEFTFIQDAPSTTVLASDEAGSGEPDKGPPGDRTFYFDAQQQVFEPEFTLTFIESFDPSFIGRQTRIASFPFRIGRAGPDLCITSDVGVSREHCQIQRNQGACQIVDLNSANGTFLNGRRVPSGKAETIPFGAVIRLGSATALIFSSEQVAELPHLTGQVIADRFRLTRMIRNGSKTALYEASDSHLPQSVAVKILSPSLASYPGYLEQFRREAETAVRLRHPRICGVFDYGQTQIRLAGDRSETCNYLAMELMEGVGLSEYTSSKTPLPLERIVSFLDEVTDALGYAHEMGIIHGGIKLSSFVFDGQEKAYVTDFGMASRQDDQSHRILLGSPEFLAPEQWDNLQPTAQVDQFSLAVLTYVLVTGSYPFEGQQYPTVRQKNFIRGPIPAHEEAARASSCEVPSGLSRVLGRAMSVKPEERYPSVRDFFFAFKDAIRSPKKASHENPTIFISYQRDKSSGWANYFATELERKHGILAFVDTRRADRVVEVPTKIRKAIEDCDVFVCLLAGRTLQSKWVQKEVQIAWEKGKLMVPVFQESFVAPDDSELDSYPHIKTLVEYDGVHLLDRRNIKVDNTIDELAKMIRDSVAKPRSETAE